MKNANVDECGYYYAYKKLTSIRKRVYNHVTGTHLAADLAFAGNDFTHDAMYIGRWQQLYRSQRELETTVISQWSP